MAMAKAIEFEQGGSVAAKVYVHSSHAHLQRWTCVLALKSGPVPWSRWEGLRSCRPFDMRAVPWRRDTARSRLDQYFNGVFRHGKGGLAETTAACQPG